MKNNEDIHERLMEVYSESLYHYKQKTFYKTLAKIFGILLAISSLVLFIIFLNTREEKNKDNLIEKVEYKFLVSYIGNKDIVDILYKYSYIYDVDVILATSLMRTESEFNPKAFNRNTNGSVDRGLFQLNDNSFPGLTNSEFYDIDKNILCGIKHLRYCLNESNNNVVKALAIYNAGKYTVTKGRVKEMTLDHINKTIATKHFIETEILKILSNE